MSPASRTDTRLWLRSYRPEPQARVRVVMFPHGGGSASFYRPLARLLPPALDPLVVQYPGREDRLAEPVVDRMGLLADALADALAPLFDRPVAFFGHSMGASVAHEVTRRLRPRHGVEPTLLAVSGRPGPRHQKPGDKHLDDDRLWREVTRLGGTSDQLASNDTLRSLVLPALRADYRLIETYAAGVRQELSCAVAAAVGADDDEVPLGELLSWSETSRGPFSFTVFPGRHFYLREDPEPVAGWLAGAVLSAAGMPHS